MQEPTTMAGSRAQPGQLELKITAVVGDPTRDPELHVYLAGRNDILVVSKPEQFAGALMRGNSMVVAVDDKHHILGVSAVYSGQKQVYKA